MLESSRLFVYFHKDGCRKESEIEELYSKLIEKTSSAKYTKARLGIGITDGIFNNGNFWILQETKRDIHINTEEMFRQILQSLMYLGNVYFDVSIYDLNKFKGIILDSANYFCFVSKAVVDELMQDFEEVWLKNYRVAPSKAYQVPELWDFIRHRCIKMKAHLLKDNFDVKKVFSEIWN